MPLGWWTDLEVARRSGARIAARDDCTVVKTPDNPSYYWGNYIVVPAQARPGAAQEIFAREFPQPKHQAIGLLGQPEHA